MSLLCKIYNILRVDGSLETGLVLQYEPEFALHRLHLPIIRIYIRGQVECTPTPEPRDDFDTGLG
jgi:hypothetical protein